MTCTMLVAGCGTSEPAADDPKKADDVIAACEAPSLALPDGSCIRPGIPLDGCSEGFEHDGEYGCDPILPAEACDPGMMAVPGDATCRPVMPCGAGRWGDLPVDATTEYVDGSYSGGGSDGTSDKPWTRVQDAYDAAPAGALVAIAAGRYVEDLDLGLKPIRLWGVCPEKVSIEGHGPTGAIYLGEGSGSSELGGLAVTSATFGITIAGERNVSLERIWIHDTGRTALATLARYGAPSVRMSGSLLESATGFGVYVGGSSELEMIASVVRNTAATAEDQSFGGGLRAQMDCDEVSCDEALRPTVVIEQSVFHHNHHEGVSGLGADLTMTGSVVHDTLPEPASQGRGHGVVILPICTQDAYCTPQHLGRGFIRGSVVTGNHSVGIQIEGSDATIENTVVRGTLPRTLDQKQGVGVFVNSRCITPACDTATAGNGIIRQALVEGNRGAAIFVQGSAATIESTVARDTLPEQYDLGFGVGIGAQAQCRDELHCGPARASELKVSGSLVEDNQLAGIQALYSSVHLSRSAIRRTSPLQSEGTYGDGLVFAYLIGAPGNIVDNVRIEDSARAGMASFGAAMNVSDAAIACAAFALVGQDLPGWEHAFRNLGGNQCGCPTPSAACKSVSAGLEPPIFSR